MIAGRNVGHELGGDKDQPAQGGGSYVEVVTGGWLGLRAACHLA